MNSSDSIMHRVLPYHNRAFHPVFLDLVLERVNAMAERFCGAGHTFQQYVDQNLGGDHRAYDLFHKHKLDYYFEAYEHTIASAFFQGLLSVPKGERVIFIRSIQNYFMHLVTVWNQLCGVNPKTASWNDPRYARYEPIFNFIGAVFGDLNVQSPFFIFRTLLREMSDEDFQVCMELTLHDRDLDPPIPEAVSVYYAKLAKEKAPFFAWLLTECPRQWVAMYFIVPMMHYVDVDLRDYYDVNVHSMDRMHSLLRATS